jgi:1-acyl-sn-glycerol-3-phosphate acyltransferase
VAEISAIVALGLYGLGVAAFAVWDCTRSGLPWTIWLFYGIERLYVGLMFHWRANRRCPFPNRGPAIILANHRSPVDPLLIWMNHHLSSPQRRIRVIRFMMAREYYEVPIMRWICRTMQAIPVDRRGKDVRPTHQALELLNEGHLLGLFPEGRINTGTNLLEGDPGIAWLALHARAPVYPVFLGNSPQSQSMVKPFYTPSSVCVVYGDPIDLSAYYGLRVTHSVLTEVTDLLMRRLAQLGGVIYAKDVCALSSALTEAAGPVDERTPSSDANAVGL